MRLLPFGDDALLVEPDDAGSVLALGAAARRLDGVREVVPAARTLLVVCAPSTSETVTASLRSLDVGSIPSPPTLGSSDAHIVLDVHYDGADLAGTAAEVGLEADGLVRAHSAAEYVVAFCGFVPGFGYLTGLPPELHVPRLAEPRTRVPAGSVAIADEFTGVYPRVSPGGWRLLGRTDAPLWDLERTPPAVLVPGTRVHFRAV